MPLRHADQESLSSLPYILARSHGSSLYDLPISLLHTYSCSEPSSFFAF